MAHHSVQTRRKKMMHEMFLKKKVNEIIWSTEDINYKVVFAKGQPVKKVTYDDRICNNLPLFPNSYEYFLCYCSFCCFKLLDYFEDSLLKG